VSIYSENQITTLPTIARQVERDATIPINIATHKESFSFNDGKYCDRSSL